MSTRDPGPGGAALRRHRRRGHERPRARRPRARRERHGLRPRRRLALRRRRCARRGSSRRSATTPPTCPPDAELVVSSRDPAREPGARARASAASASCTAPTLLGELTRLRPTIAVTGTHGKTTTSSMLVHALRGCGLDPGYLVGGAVRSTGANAGWGAGEWLVVEADESDRSLLELAPDDRRAHQRRARPPHDLRLPARRRRHVPRVPRARRSAAVVWDRPALLALAPAASTSCLRRRARADRRRLALRARRRRGRALGPGRPQRPQRRRRADRGAARRAPTSRGRGAALRDFQGAGRRFERLGTTAAGAEVVDDYAHHPTEVAATLEAARTLAPRRVVAVFQPHLFSRTQRAGARSSAARWRSPTRSWCSTSTRRASARRTSRASPACSSPRRPPTPAAAGRVAWMPDHAAAEAYLRDASARGRPRADARRRRRRRARPRARRLTRPGRRSPRARRSTGAMVRRIRIRRRAARGRWRSPRSALRARLAVVPRLELRRASSEVVDAPAAARSEGEQVRRRARGGRRRDDARCTSTRTRSRDAVEPFSSVGRPARPADFPHALRIEVARAPAGRASSQTSGARGPGRPAAGCCCAASAPTTLPIVTLDRAAGRGPRARTGARSRALRGRGRRARARCGARSERALLRRRAASALDLDGRPGPRVRRRATPRRRSGRRRRACSPRPRRRARPTSTCGSRAGRRGRRRAARPTGADAGPERPTASTLNPQRLRIAQLSTRGRDFGGLQSILPRFALFDIGKEIPVPCGNPRRQRALQNARL